MIVYRISTKKRIENITGVGAKLAGGRWNPKGLPVLYTASNSSLAILETLVHVDFDLLPLDLFIAEIKIPDTNSIQVIKKEDLPKNWSTYPSPDILNQIGKNWIVKNEFLILKVPSSVNQNEFNFIINPNHELFSSIKIIQTYSYKIDDRQKK